MVLHKEASNERMHVMLLLSMEIETALLHRFDPLQSSVRFEVLTGDSIPMSMCMDVAPLLREDADWVQVTPLAFTCLVGKSVFQVTQK